MLYYVCLDTNKNIRNYLLAQAQVDTGTLANSIAALNTATTFAPLQPLHNTDVAGYLRHAHEQSIISTIEEGRRETLLEFQRVLDERVRRDWEARKKRIFEELGEGSTFFAPESKQSRSGAVRVRSIMFMAKCARLPSSIGPSISHRQSTTIPHDGLRFCYILI